MAAERRREDRIPVGFYVRQMVDGEPHRCFTTNLSTRGIFIERVLSPMDRCSDVVQVEVPLPGEGDTLWTRGEVVYDRFERLFHGTAIRFTGMAKKHRRLLRSWLRETSHAQREQLVFENGVWIHRP
jgi:hypothetical protein